MTDSEQELSQCSTALDAWEKIVKQESNQWYNQLKQLVSKTLEKRTSNRAVDYEQQILKYKKEWVILEQLHDVDPCTPEYSGVQVPDQTSRL